jgi:membrane protease YdiL (CAAX protease family)
MRGLFLDPEGSVRNGWKVLGFILLFNVTGWLSTPLVRGLASLATGLGIGKWLDLGVCLLASWGCLRLEGEPFVGIGLRPNTSFLVDLMLGCLGGLGLMVVTAAGIYAFGGLHWARNPGVGVRELLQGASFFLAVAAFEELVFRGYPFQRLVRGLGFTRSQVLFAAGFALLHWGNPGMSGATRAWATVNIALAAVLLGLCWQRTGSLALPIGVHLGWNWTQGNLLGFGVSGTLQEGWWTPVFQGRPQWLTGGDFGLEASLICTLVCGAAIFGLWRWRGRISADASTASAS